MRQAAALVVPLRVAGGTRIKILEAWAEGVARHLNNHRRRGAGRL